MIFSYQLTSETLDAFVKRTDDILASDSPET